MVNLTVFTLITGNLLLVKPPANVYQVEIQYGSSNIPEVSSDEQWYLMHTKLYYGSRISTINIKSDKMFLFTKYRLYFMNHTRMDTSWDLHVWNQDRLQDYFFTSTIILWSIVFICISLIFIIIYILKFK